MAASPKSDKSSATKGARTADVLRALSLATDLAVGLTPEHSARACLLGMQVADVLELSETERANLFYTELLVEAGCTAWSGPLAAALRGDEIAAARDYYFALDARSHRAVLAWMLHHLAPGAPLHSRLLTAFDVLVRNRGISSDSLLNTAEVARQFARRLGMSGQVQEALYCRGEQWDGEGPRKLQGEEIPIVARIVYATQVFTAAVSMVGLDEARQIASDRRGTAFDPAVVDAITAVSQDAPLFETQGAVSAWDALMEMEPDSEHRYADSHRLGQVALSFADFVDIKSAVTLGHSRRVASVAESMAGLAGLPPDEADTVRVAALAHDLGLVAVPTAVLEKPAELRTPAEIEQIRLHSYNGERILSTGSAWNYIAPLVGAHHERFDGKGYYRGLAGESIPFGARIIAVADRFDHLIAGTPGHPPVSPAEALDEMSKEEGSAFCPDAMTALRQHLGYSVEAERVEPQRREWPSGLTDREVEVLRLAASGLTRKQIASTIYVTEGTVRSHLEHIYGKIDVSTRAAATLFAVEHDLLN